MPGTIIAVPCFNWAQRLRNDEFARFAAAVPPTGFVLVSDGSTDEALEILRKLEERDSDERDRLVGHRHYVSAMTLAVVAQSNALDVPWRRDDTGWFASVDNRGLRVGDLVLEVDETSVWALPPVVLALMRYAPSSARRLTVLREKKDTVEIVEVEAPLSGLHRSVALRR